MKLVFVLLFLFVLGCAKEDIEKFSENLVPASEQAPLNAEFSKKTGSGFDVYYPSNEADADNALAVLDDSGVRICKTYFGITPKNAPVFIAETPEEKSALINKGVVSALKQFMNEDIRYLPGFLIEGMAGYSEKVFLFGDDFTPAVSVFLPLKELGDRCDGYINDKNLSSICINDGIFVVWYVIENYGESSFSSFLEDLKQTHDWKISLSKITGRTTTQFDEILKTKIRRMGK